MNALLILALLLEGATIQGTVRAEGSLEPIAGAVINLPELRRMAVADVRGYFVLSDIPAGRWRVQASAMGYAGHALTIESSGSGTIRIDFDLAVRPIVLPRIGAASGSEVQSPRVSAPASAGPPAMQMEGAALRIVPGLVEADVFRSLQLLPAVRATSDFSTALYVRGGSSDQNLITLDGVPIFNPYHVGGLFSAIDAAAVSTVDVWAGALPARSAGDRLASTVAIHTRDGGRDRLRAEGAIGLLSTRLSLDGPLPGGKGGFLLAGRRTYLDLATDLAHAVGVSPATIPYDFSDLYAKLTRPVGALGSLAVSAYIDDEDVTMTRRMRAEFEGDADFDWGSRMLSASWRQPLSAALLLEVRAGYSDFSGHFDTWGLIGPPTQLGDTSFLRAHAFTRDLLASADLTWFHRNRTTRVGLQLDHYLFDNSLDRSADLEPNTLPLFDFRQRAVTRAAYLEELWRPSDRLELRAGLRLLDGGNLGRAWLPRLGAHWRPSPGLALSAGAGRYAQALRSMRDDEAFVSSFVAYDVLAPQPAEVGLARGDDVVLSAEWSSSNTTIRIDAFQKWMRNLILPAEPDDPLNTPVFVVDDYRVGTGSARGFELFAKQRWGRVELGLAYAFSQAERKSGSDVFAPRFEREHTLDGWLNLPLGARGLLTTRAVLGSGQPSTPAIGMASPAHFNPATGTWGRMTEGANMLTGAHNSTTTPGYFRLDVAARKSFDKRWFGRATTVTPYLQVLNILNTRNTLLAEPQSISGARIAYRPQMPLLPTFGLEWKF